jgi:long-chain acyl-CoA synthetase
VNLAASFEGHPEDKVAIISRGHPTTYGELARQTAELRGGLARLGVEPGDRVAILTANNVYFALAYVAVLGLGAVAVPLNPTAPTGELEQQMHTVGVRVALTGPSARDAVAAIAAKGGLDHVVAFGDADIEGATAAEDLLGGEVAAIVDRSEDDLACMIFTAGTGGAPKAAMLSHGNLLSNLQQVQRHPGRAVEASDVCFGVLPLFHIFGLNVVLGLTLFAGATVVLVERFDPVSTVETVERHGITILPGAPPMFAALAATSGDRDALRTLRLTMSGASALPDEVGRRFEERFGVTIYQGYGLTEASPIVTSSIIGGTAKPGSIGVPLPGVQVRLVDEEGEDALLGDEGEIWVRGPNVFKGYWNEPEATARVLTEDGWLRTGDVAVADDDGYLYIVDRQKDLIIVSGFNVYPAEVEEVLASMPGIDQVAVAGVEHPYTGETVKAWVVTGNGARLDEDAVIDYCATRLARYKCPTKVTFVDELPRGLGGKLLRRALG